jgi:hypothetical protein
MLWALLSYLGDDLPGLITNAGSEKFGIIRRGYFLYVGVTLAEVSRLKKDALGIHKLDDLE